jgi:hypothetical protein
LIFKRKIPTEQCKQNHTTAPYITQIGNIPLSCNHLWCSIAWRTTCRFEKLPILKSIAETEVDNFDVPVIIEQQILWLEITMNHVHFMDLLYTRKNLMK